MNLQLWFVNLDFFSINLYIEKCLRYLGLDIFVLVLGVDINEFMFAREKYPWYQILKTFVKVKISYLFKLYIFNQYIIQHYAYIICNVCISFFLFFCSYSLWFMKHIFYILYYYKLKIIIFWALRNRINVIAILIVIIKKASFYNRGKAFFISFNRIFDNG